MLRMDINLLFEIINLLVFYLLMKKFLFGPVLGIMEKRKSMIDGQLKHAKTTEQNALSLKEQYEQTMQNAESESEEIRRKAREDAKEEYNRILEDADKKADKLMENAQKKIELERAKTLQDVQSQITGLAMAATVKIVGEHGKEGSKNLYGQFLKKAGESNESGIH
mgnify:CR=1 FL=1